MAEYGRQMAADPTTTAVCGARSGGVSVGQRILGAVALVPVLAYLVVAVPRVGYPYELTYFEGSIVEVTARVVAGQPLYVAPTIEWSPWPYPPLYFWLSGALAYLTGVSLLPMRLVSLAASLAGFVLVALIVRRFGGSTVAGLVGAGLFAATYRVSGAWFDTARVDSLLLALLLAAVYTGMRVRTWRGGLVVGAVLFLAFLTKQNTLIVAAPMLLWLLVRRRSVGMAAITTLGPTVVGSTVLGDLTTGGWYSGYVIRQLVSQSWAFRWLYDFWLLDLVEPFAVSLVVVAVGLAVWWRRGHRPVRRIPRDDTAYLLACVLGLLGAAWAARVHEGGYANVSIPAQAAAAVVLGCLLARVLHSERATTRVVAGLAAGRAAVGGGPRCRRPVRRVAVEAAGPGARADAPVLPAAGRATRARVGDRDLRHLPQPRRVRAPQLDAALEAGRGVESTVILDNRSDVGMFGDALTSQFTLVTSTYIPHGVFEPHSDLAAHPTRLYVRTSELSRLPSPLGG